jgi:KEOPS complex subunit Cgi121
MHVMEQKGRTIVVLGGRTRADKDSLLSSAAGISSANKAVRVLNAQKVFGKDHVLSALQKAARAFDNGQNVSDSLATETMLYMSGCRQIQEAVELFGIKEEVGQIVIIADHSADIEEKLKGFPIQEDESVLEGISGKDIAGFGISGREAGSVPDKLKLDLVLERVAGVDIKKK